MTDEPTLIEQARAGDGSAIQALYRCYADRVFSVVRRLAGDDALAEDWAQETWIRAIRALPTFRGDAQFGTWLHRIAVNSALYGKRGRERKSSREEPLPDSIPARTGSDQTLLRMRLERALAQLPEGMRRVLVLHDVEGYTHAEIGTMLGVAPGTCKSQLFKARARMRQILAGADGTLIREEVCNT